MLDFYSHQIISILFLILAQLTTGFSHWLSLGFFALNFGHALGDIFLIYYNKNNDSDF